MGYYEPKEGYKKPDIHAPRFRKTRNSVLTKALFKKYKKQHPGTQVDYKTFKDVILRFNELLWRSALQKRDGFEFPKGLGRVMITSCQRKKGAQTDDKISAIYNKKINHKNWESNQYLMKILYSTYGNKYNFTNHEFYSFHPSREFKRAASKHYRVHWNMYVKLGRHQKISNYMKSQGTKSVKLDNK